MTDPLITPDEYKRFTEFFYKKTGILFDDSKRYFVDKRLIDRVNATKSGTFRLYFNTLKGNAANQEVQLLTNLMTVNETYFFRESYQFDCLVHSLLEEVTEHKKPGETVRIWSLPCSSGEEPYSIVIYLLEQWAKLDAFDVEIFASDIDTHILKSAQEGVFSPRSVQNVSPEQIRRYFTKRKDGNFQISDSLRESVDFSRVNINEPADMRRFSRIDVVFCRNMLIYFDDLSRRAAAEALYEAMSPGAFICLGHSESMGRISSLFKIRKFNDAMVYQKPR